MLRHAVSKKMTGVSEVLTASIIRAMSACEKLLSFYKITRQNIPDNSDQRDRSSFLKRRIEQKNGTVHRKSIHLTAIYNSYLNDFSM
jgi:hypothetical protein